jgi:hypothetical protein
MPVAGEPGELIEPQANSTAPAAGPGDRVVGGGVVHDVDRVEAVDVTGQHHEVRGGRSDPIEQPLAVACGPAAADQVGPGRTEGGLLCQHEPAAVDRGRLSRVQRELTRQGVRLA